jgi:hypothetical protein
MFFTFRFYSSAHAKSVRKACETSIDHSALPRGFASISICASIRFDQTEFLYSYSLLSHTSFLIQITGYGLPFLREAALHSLNSEHSLRHLLHPLIHSFVDCTEPPLHSLHIQITLSLHRQR